MRYTFNKHTLIAQFDKELVRALCAASTMTDYELETAYVNLYAAATNAHTAIMSRIIGEVWDIYGEEMGRRRWVMRARLRIEETISELGDDYLD